MFRRIFSSTSKPLTQIRHGSSMVNLKFKSLPRTNGFIIDYRRDRQVLLEDWYPRGLNRPIKIELIDENDIEFMTHYVTEHFTQNSNIVQSLNIKGDVMIEVLGPQVNEWIRSNNSNVAKDGDKLVGICFGSTHDRSEFPILYNNELHHENPKFIIKDDYAEDIRNGPCSHPDANRILVFLNELITQTGKFLPKDCQKIALQELYSIHPAYEGYGVASKCGSLIRDIMIKQGCTHEVGYCVAIGTHKIMTKKMGHKTIFEFPYDKYRENGKPIFTNLRDGATSALTTMARIIP